MTIRATAADLKEIGRVEHRNQHILAVDDWGRHHVGLTQPVRRILPAVALISLYTAEHAHKTAP